MANETGTIVGPDNSPARPTQYEIISSKRGFSYANGWTGEMVWKLNFHSWDDANQFVTANVYQPFPATNTGSPGLATPGVPLYPQQFQFDPWDNSTILNTDGSPTICRATAHFALDFLNFPWPADIERPPYLNQLSGASPGSGVNAPTTLKMTENFSGQFLTLPAGACVWVDGTPPTKSVPTGGTPVSISTGICIPMQEFHVEWDRVTPLMVQQLNAMNLSNYEGTVNDVPFMGYTPECVLMESCAAATFAHHRRGKPLRLEGVHGLQGPRGA